MIVGATHPELLRREGETYRQRLLSLATSLGVVDHVRFVGRFVDPEELGAWLTAADIFVTPYPNLDQIVSGTLSYAMGAGKAIVSTPYAYARERLARGRGRLVAAGSTPALGAALIELAGDRELRESHGRRAYAYSMGMHWPEVGAAYRRVFDRVSRRSPQGSRSPCRSRSRPPPRRSHVPDRPLSPARRQHLERMTGPLGIWQHADGCRPGPRVRHLHG